VDVALVGRAGGEAIAARAHDADFVVSGMYGCFHVLLTSVPSFSGNYSILKDARRIQQMETAAETGLSPRLGLGQFRVISHGFTPWAAFSRRSAANYYRSLSLRRANVLT